MSTWERLSSDEGTDMRQGPQEDCVLEVREVSKRFAGLLAVDAVSLTVKRGEIMGLIGSNGAGKTTLLHVLYGEHRSDGGQIFFDGVEISGLSTEQRARAGIGLVFQITSVFSELSVEKNLRLGAMPKLVHARGASQGDTSRESLSKRVDAMLETIDLVDERFVSASELSHGQKQWLEIGMVLLTKPKLLLLDEPTSGMTRDESRRTAGLLRSLQESGAAEAIMVVEHNIEFMKLVSDRVTVMHRGAVLAAGTLEEVENDPAVRDSYLGRLK